MKNLVKSGVSQAIQSFMCANQTSESNICSSRPKEFTIKIANTIAEKESAFQLAYEVYLSKRFILENVNKWLIQNYDFEEDTVILIVQDQQKNIAGTVTLVFDKSSNLPADKIYKIELNQLKNSGAKLVEISRLVICPEYRNSKEILVLLFNYLAIYAHHVKKYNHLIVEVNPRHKEYYKSQLKFKQIGSEKLCPQVHNEPAVLLYLPTGIYQEEVTRCSKTMVRNKKERSLYPFFIRAEQENLVALYLQNQASPMSLEEKIYFGVSISGIQEGICI